MTSKDNQQYLTVDMFNAKMDAFMATIRLENEKLRNELHSEIQSVKSELHSEIKAVETEVKVNSALIADMQTSITVYFTIATVFIALIGIMISTLIAFAPRIWAFFENRAKTKAITQEQVQEIVDKAIAKAFSSITK